MRVVSAQEAYGTIAAIPFCGRSHAVTTLPVHGPGQQLIVFEDGEDPEALIDSNRSKLMAYFDLCASSRNAGRPLDVLYADVVVGHVWLTKTHQWKEKSRKTGAIGRLQQVSLSPHNQNFYIRLLLVHQRGVVSFDDLRTVNGHLCDDFKAACVALGIVEDVHVYERCRQELSEAMTSYHLRKLFARILASCDVSNALGLWEHYKDILSSDFENHLQRTGRVDVDNHQLALAGIQRVLDDFGLNFGLPVPSNMDDLCVAGDALVADVPEVLDEEGIARQGEEADRLVQSLNAEQMAVFNAVFDCLLNPPQGSPQVDNLFFGDRPGGTGKTYLFNAIIKRAQILQIPFVSTAYTGLAASLLICGRTCHTAFKIPTNDVDMFTTSSLHLQSTAAQNLRKSAIMFIDEVSMLSKYQLNAGWPQSWKTLNSWKSHGKKSRPWNFCTQALLDISRTAMTRKCVPLVNINTHSVLPFLRPL